MPLYEFERDGDILILLPRFDGNGFRYAEFHRESSSLRHTLAGPDVRHLVIDLENVDYFGSEFIGMMITFANEIRSGKGKTAICGASEQMLEVLRTMNFNKIIPHFPSRDAALQFLAE